MTNIIKKAEKSTKTQIKKNPRLKDEIRKGKQKKNKNEQEVKRKKEK